MKFEYPNFGWFSVVDKPTVRQILTYKGSVGAAVGVDGVNYGHIWKGIKPLIDEWSCKHVEDYRSFDLDGATDFKAADVIIWACVEVANWMTDLEATEKNS